MHLTLVQHVTCPEHGELIHAEAGAEFYTLSLSAPAGEGERQSVTSGTEAEHEHDHCPVLLSRREDAAAATPRVCPFADLPRLAGLTAPAESPHAQVIAILHLAPKNSPTPL